MSLHAWRQAWLLLFLLTVCRATDELDADLADAEEREKPHVLEVVEPESNMPDPNIQIRVLQRHGRAPIPPAAGRTPSTDEELMREFDEVTVEWYTSELVSSILLRLPERQEQLMKTNATFDGYKFFTGPSNECKFQVSDKHVLPDDLTQPAHNLADEKMISSCIADNSDTKGTQARRSAAQLKLHPEPMMHHEAGWRYFSMLIRNPQKTPIRSSMDGKMANTFQLVMNNTAGKTLVAMSFEALKISPVWVCSYTPWFKTSACTAACGGGYMTEVRRLLHAPPEKYDVKLLVDCHEALIRATPCNTHECDVDCQLSEWTPWPNECSRSCGNGTLVERRGVVMGPKGKGKICPPWHTQGVRVLTVPCNEFPCEPSCAESPLADRYRSQAEASPIEIPMAEEEETEEADAKKPKDNATAESAKNSTSKSTGDKEVGSNTTAANKTQAEEEESSTGKSPVEDATTGAPSSAEEEVAEEATTGAPASTEEASDEPHAAEMSASEDATTGASTSPEEEGDNSSADANESLLSLGSQPRIMREVAYETPRLETGLVKSACSEPCGRGRRMVLIPSSKKVSSGPEDRSCAYTFDEDCNMFDCSPLMLQPGNAWQFPVVGKWFMVDVSFVIEELSESITVRAPPDFLLAATGSQSECYLVEHSLPNLEACNIFPGQETDRTGPIMVFNFSNPLEPQNSYTWKRDWYYFRTWVQHPKECTGGIKNGRCLGQVGERQWVLAIRDSQPEPLWEYVKGSYEIFANETTAKEVFEANGVKDLSFTEDAEEVTTTTTTTVTTTTTKTEKEEKAKSTKEKDSAEAESETDEEEKEKDGANAKGSLMEQQSRQAHTVSHSSGKDRTRKAHPHTQRSSHQEGHDPLQAQHPRHRASRSQRKMTS